MTVKFKDLRIGQEFKFKGNPTILKKLNCPNDPLNCYALCVTDHVVHKAGDLFIGQHGPYHEQEMLTSEVKGVWA